MLKPLTIVTSTSFFKKKVGKEKLGTKLRVDTYKTSQLSSPSLLIYCNMYLSLLEAEVIGSN